MYTDRLCQELAFQLQIGVLVHSNPKGEYLGSCDLFKFWDYILKTVQDIDIEAMEVLIGNHVAYRMAPIRMT